MFQIDRYNGFAYTETIHLMLEHLHRNTKVLVSGLIMFLSSFWILAQNSYSPKDSLQYYYQQSLTFRHQNKISSAMEALEKAAKLAERNEDLKALLDTYHKFALLYLEINDRETTLFYWDRAGVLLNDTEYPYGEAIHKYIDAILLYRSGNNFQAMNELEEAKKLNNDKNLLNNILLAEGNIFLNIEKFEEASVNYNALLVNSDEFERAYLATLANLGLASLHDKMDKFDESIKHGEAALELAQKHSFFREIVTASNFLASSYEKVGDYQKSLVLNKDLTQIKDSLFTIEKVKLEAKTAEKIKFQQQSKTISELDAEIEEIKASANRSEITAILASAFLVIISKSYIIICVNVFCSHLITIP